MKARLFLVICLFVTLLIAGCGAQPTPNATLSPSPGLTATPLPTNATGGPTVSPGENDVNTTASIVNTAEAFKQAIGTNGTWIICLLSDLTINEPITLEGEYKNGKKDEAGKDVIQRKIALYTQDDNRKVTARFTLTAPSLTITSPNARIQSGTFKGDLYVNVKDFELVDTTVEGNVYFGNDEFKNSFKMDTTSKVTGTQEVKANP